MLLGFILFDEISQNHGEEIDFLILFITKISFSNFFTSNKSIFKSLKSTACF